MRLLEYLFVKLVNYFGSKLPKCGSCKTRLQPDGEPPLFLLPVFYRDTYTPSVPYYKKNCVPIGSMAEIPTGQRACRFVTLTCPECGQHQLLVEDFLKVRDTESVESRTCFDMGAFDLLQMSQPASHVHSSIENSHSSTVQKTISP